MTKLISLLFVFFCAISATAQPYSKVWQKCYGGSSGESAKTVFNTAEGGFIMAGSSYSINEDLTENKGKSDYWVVKTDTSGKIEWQKSYGGSNEDYANSIIQTLDGGYIVAGYSYSADGDKDTSYGSSDYWILKLNKLGEIEWQKSYGGSHEDNATLIKQTKDGGYMILGSSDSKDGQITDNRGGIYYSDYWLVKTNNTGEIEWQRSIGGTGDDIPTSIEQLTDNGFIMAGISFSNDWDVSGNHGNGDFWVVRLNDTGSIIWEKSLGGSGIDYCSGLAVTKTETTF